ncbi:hypothetical protein [Streptomyces neyagawaensis]|uniref:hypothetical protein n=1 Tax=Streptomyces neyagawaensis TaxID=42238 RepID=UPI0007C86424|nr:hypothetical protein [Streptomyces neyagawaensis]MCL6738475.1 hypothetical protein [Streptomyces neyagawaensis]MDE1688699.1 hypothetical protein [Streptomyces neyagawaensis]
MTIDQTTHQPVRRPSEAAVPSAEDSVPVAPTAPVPPTAPVASAVAFLPAGEDEIDGAEPHIVRGID